MTVDHAPSFRRQMATSVIGAGMVIASVAFLMFVTFEERRVASERDTAAAGRDAALYVRVDSAYIIASRLERLWLQSNQNTARILDGQEAEAAEQKKLLRALVATLRRDVRAVPAKVESLSLEGESRQ